MVNLNLSELAINLQIPRIDDVYHPSDDSYLVIDYLDSPEFEELVKKLFELKKKVRILDMGCGTGLLGFCTVYKLLSTSKFESVHLLYTDINQKAIEVTKFLVNENFYHIKNLINFKKGSITFKYHVSDLFEVIPSQKFDIVLFNPPYLPQDEEIQKPKPIDNALYGGPEGISVLNTFFSNLKMFITEESHVFFIASTLGALNKFLPQISINHRITLLQNLHMFFEDFALFHAKKKSQNTNKV